jgi:hypothetical protein
VTMPSLPPDGDNSWGAGDWGAEVHNRVQGNGAAGTPTVRTLGTGASEASAGNHTHTGSSASETVAGTVELADATEAAALSDLSRAISPGRLNPLMAAKANAVVTTTTQSGTTHTLSIANASTDIEYTGATGCAVTIPLNATSAFAVGTIINLWQRGAAQVVVGGPGAAAGGGTAGGVTVESRGSVFKTAGVNAVMTLKKRATDGWLVTGDISS